MLISEMQNIETLDQEDQEKVAYFIRLLRHHAKYQTLKKEVAQRREEISQGKIFTHETIWESFDV